MKSFLSSLILLIASACAVERTAHGIPNFSKVNDRIYRGGQPNTEGLAWLRTNGFKYIVKLNSESEGLGWDSGVAFVSSPYGEGFAVDRVTFWCASTNGYGPEKPCFEVSFLPIDFQQQMIGPVPKIKINNALRQMRWLPVSPQDRGNGPGKLFVHCEHGQDRTGLIVACYRVQFEGWTKAQAEKEMMRLGFHKVLHGLWEFWEGFTPAP